MGVKRPNTVSAWSQQPPPLSHEGGCHILLLQTEDGDDGSLHSSPSFVGDETSKTPKGGLEVGKQGLLVVLPVALQLGFKRVLAAAQLDGHLHAVGEEVVEVLHPPLHDVPLGTVGDPTLVEQVSRTSRDVGTLRHVIISREFRCCELMMLKLFRRAVVKL